MIGPLRFVWCRECAHFRGFWKSGRTNLVHCKVHKVNLPPEGQDEPCPKCFLAKEVPA
jgi:hypothetical protein